ncbi:MAG TPA: TonB-dependent receptor, partial [Sphingomicrobium sp.]|nr:TonB-dependent receptor [Sphingomicrobium sp.]
RAAGRYRLSPTLLLGASGFALRGKSEFDGYDAFFQRADTLDETHNRLAAGRIFAELGDRQKSYALASASLLGSSNRNELDDQFLNETEATRRMLLLEGGDRFGKQQLIAAVESERETFEARDTAFGGFTNQDRSRNHQSLTAEWRASRLGPINTSLAIRHDIFSDFKDATSFRVSAKAGIGSGFSLAVSYGEGIAQPTFFDLYGFFPGSFIGNPDLKPESSRGGEVSLRYAADRLGGSITYYRQRLKDEIATVFLPDFTSTAVNAVGKSRRQGVELEGYYHHNDALRLSVSYGWLHASEPEVGGGQIKEPRRPKHSGSVALNGTRGRLTYGAAIAYTGERSDTNFDVFPSQLVELDPYWLASARVAYRLTDELEAHVRVANAFDDDYQDAIGYRSEGRSIHAGLRVALGR